MTSLKEYLSNGGTAFSDCHLDPSSFKVTETRTSGYCQVITRRYEVNDSCGIHLSCQQIIEVKDTTPPIITCPPDYTLISGGIIPLPYGTYQEFLDSMGTFSDNCAIDSTSWDFIGETQNIYGFSKGKSHHPQIFDS